MASNVINVSNIPQPLRAIAFFVKIGNEYAARDVVIQYWCLLKALEDGMKCGGDPDVKKFLLELMTVLEKLKQANKDNEAISQEVVAQSHIEEEAQRLFQLAYAQDQQGQFGQKMIRQFFTAGYLFDVLTCFGQLDDNVQSARKYAKWRAVEVNNCLKRGEEPAPAGGQQTLDQQEKAESNDDISTQINDKLSAELSELNASINGQQTSRQHHSPTISQQQTFVPSNQPGYGYGTGAHQLPSAGQQLHGPPPNSAGYQWPSSYQQPGLQPQFNPSERFGQPAAAMPQQQVGFAQPFHQQQQNQPKISPLPQASSPISAVQLAKNLTLEDYLEAKKLTKYASSALDYEDPKTAIDYLQKAIGVLQKGAERGSL